MKKSKFTITILCIALISLFSMAGCNLFEKIVEEKDLIIYTNRDSTEYVYSNKIAIIDRNNSTDSLILRNDGEITDNKEWIEFGAVMVKGQFEKSAYYDGILFILNDDGNYYSISIDDFDVKDFNYNILTYTQKELEIAYPDYERFDWYNRE